MDKDHQHRAERSAGDMKCFHPMCSKAAPYDTLFRINAKGQPGVWACWEHKANTDQKHDPGLDDLVKVIEQRIVGCVSHRL